MTNKIEFISVLLVSIQSSKVLAGTSTICISIYYISMLKINVVDVKYNGSWSKYFKSWFRRKRS